MNEITKAVLKVESKEVKSAKRRLEKLLLMSVKGIENLSVSEVESIRTLADTVSSAYDDIAEACIITKNKAYGVN